MSLIISTVIIIMILIMMPTMIMEITIIIMRRRGRAPSAARTTTAWTEFRRGLGGLQGSSPGGSPALPVSLNKKHSLENHIWEEKLSECHIGGWRAVSAAELHGKGSPKRNVLFKDTIRTISACPPGVSSVHQGGSSLGQRPRANLRILRFCISEGSTQADS